MAGTAPNIDRKLLQQFAADPMEFILRLRIPAARGPCLFGDCMEPFQRQLFAKLAPSLRAVALGEKPPIGRFWMERTKGAAKDSDCAAMLLWLLCFSRRPIDCQVGAADKDQAAELRKRCLGILQCNPWLNSTIQIDAWKIVNPRNGSQCDIIAADVAGSHGAIPDLLILNELSHVTKQEFAENLLDNASKVPNNLTVIATNAGFLDTWQHRWRELARTSDRWLFHKFEKPAPWLDAAEIEEAEQRNSKSRFVRLWAGQWLSGAGDAIDLADIESCINQDGPMIGNEKDFSFVSGLDLSTKRDHSALCVLAADHQTGRVRLASIRSWAPIGGKIDLVVVRNAVFEAHKQFRLNCCYFDPHQAGLMSQELERGTALPGLNGKRTGSRLRMEEMPFSGPNLHKMASELLQVFRDRRIDLFRDDGLVRDLQKLCIVERSFGYKLEAIRDEHGHCDRAIALSICLPAAIELAAQRQCFSGALPRGQRSRLADPLFESSAMRGAFSWN